MYNKNHYKEIYSKIKKIYLSNYFPFFIILIGIIIRLRQYFVNRSLWLDEASLALNIIEKNYIELLQTLNYGQAAPPVFLLITKFLVNLFGPSEYILRFLPLISGLLSLYIFYKISREFLNRKVISLALILFSFTEYNIYYSVEFKQYSLDLLFGLIILFYGIKLYKSHFRNKYIIANIFVGILSIWSSHTSVFLLAGVGSALLVEIYYSNYFTREFKIRKIKLLIFTYIIWIFNFSLHYFLIIRNTTTEHLYDYWSEYFIPFPPLSFYDLGKYLSIILGFIKNPLGISYVIGLIIFFTLIGEYFFWYRKDRIYFFMINFTILILIITSMFNIYPFASRLVLFIIPLFYILITEGIYNFYCLFTKNNKKFIAILLIIITLLYPIAMGGNKLAQPILKEEIKPVINYYLSNSTGKDNLYIYYGAIRAFRFYTYDKNITYIIGADMNDLGNRKNPGLYLEELDKLKGRDKMWFIFSHVYQNEKDLFLIYLDKIGDELDSFKTHGASIYLYDLQ